jgi:hypothetical protein
MSRQKWHTRLREIAARNPNALPEFLRGAARAQAWDRVEWYRSAQDEVPPYGVARPILTMLEWLREKSLLTPKGHLALAKGLKARELHTLSLARSMVLPRRQTFLDRVYEDWHGRWAANLAIGGEQGMRDDAKNDLEKLWRKENGPSSRTIVLP